MTNPEFLHPPGLTIRVAVANVESTDNDHDLRLGKMVRVKDGVFAGFIGHITELENVMLPIEHGNVILRQGSMADWWDYDAT